MRTRIFGVAILAIGFSVSSFALSFEYLEWGRGPAHFLMTKEEAAQWKTISSDEDAKAFIALFWARRDPTPATPLNEYQEQFGRGDFLIRNLLGADRESGALVLGDLVRPGQTIQFHARDAATAGEELQLLMKSQRDTGPAPAGGLIFSCNGRGTNMFSEPHHDAEVIYRALGDIPLAGFFAQGEFGPVGEQNFVHGFTASVALFRKGK